MNESTVCVCCTRTMLPHEVGRFACGVCERRAAAQLAELPAQLVVLRGSRVREVGAGQRVTGSRTAPLPGREDVLNLLGPSAPGDVTDPHGDQTGDIPIAGTLASWVLLIAGERHLRGPRRGSEEQLAAWLAGHLPWACRQPWVDEMLRELGAMTAAVRGITRVRPQRRALTRPCPRCDALALVATDWQPYTECSACGGLFTDAELCATAPAALAIAYRQQLAAKEAA
ncbi:hypothetical protein [Streptomyces sp. NPDC054784]